jgi:hypothetical protein
MPKMTVQGKKVYVAPIYWIIFWTSKVIIVLMMALFIVVNFTDLLSGVWIF